MSLDFARIILFSGLLALGLISCTGNPLTDPSKGQGSISFSVSIAAPDSGATSGAPVFTANPQDFATGEAILTQDTTVITKPLSILNGVATGTVQNLNSGAWTLQVNFYNATGAVSYTGSKAVTITSGRTANANVTLGATYGGLTINVALPDGNLTLWNTLGSLQEMGNPMVGESVGFASYSGAQPEFQPCKFGYGFKTTSYSYPTPPTSSFPNDKGTIEFWMKPNWSSSDPNAYIMNTGGNGGILMGKDAGQPYPYVILYGETLLIDSPDYSFAAGELHHFAITWADGGIDSTGDTARVYFDGKLVGSSKMVIRFWNRNISYFNIYGWGLPTGASQWLGAIIDNLKIYNAAKTSFSDRNVQ